MKPKLIMRNFFSDLEALKQFALENGFAGIDWSFELAALPATPAEETRWVNRLATLDPLEIRYHCPFKKVDLGHENAAEVKTAVRLFRRIIRLIAKADGKYLTLHVGLGHDTTRILSWNTTIDNLRRLVQYGADCGVKVCLENLSWGWTSKPNLFEKLIRKTGAGVTFDIGHAYACEAIHSQYYAVEDFITPHLDRVFNAHIYHTEIAEVGHMPPNRIEDIEQRLTILQNTGCQWWVIELKEVKGLLQTKRLIDSYFESNYCQASSHSRPL